MVQLRFNHVFIALMLLAAVSAFVVPQQHTEFPREKLNGFFSPIQKPMNALGYAIHEHFSPPSTAPADLTAPNTVAELREELDQEKTNNANLVTQVEELKKQNREQEALGDLRTLCTPVEVAAADVGTRETLQLSGTSRDGLAQGMPVLCPDGLAGRIDHASIGGTRVLLITDPGSKILGAFARMQHKGSDYEFVRLSTPRFLTVGGGPGMLLVTTLRMEDVTLAGVQRGDWVILDDEDWPRAVQGLKLGQVDSIEPQKSHPLFAAIVIKPRADLRRLREVMVMEKK